MTWFTYLLRLGDDALIMAQRLSEWVGRAPVLEEDMALANIALDQLGQARLLLSYAGEVEGAGRDEDALAYFRSDREFLNCQLVELPNGDFAQTIVKLLCFGVYQDLLYQRLAASADERLAAIAAKARKETAYHVDHARLWTLRLGDGTPESHRRMRQALEEVWPYTHELFEDDEVTDELAADGRAVRPGELRQPWRATVESLLREATLEPPTEDWAPTGGRRGIHTETLSYLLAQMQSVRRAYPTATRW